MKVLMATDGSPSSTTAIRTASRIVRKEKLLVDLLCVVPQLELATGKKIKSRGEIVRAQETYQNRITVEAQKILEAGNSHLALEGVKAQTLILFGSPAKVIVDLAVNYDLTVIGGHDRFQSSMPGLGHVAMRIVEHASNAVLVAREYTVGRSLRVLLGTDGSLASEHALRFMASALQLDSSEVTLMHIAETPWVHLGLEQEWFEYPCREFAEADPEGQIDRQIRRESEEIIEHSRRLLESYGLSSETISTEGDPALEILSEAERGEYDLIVLGSTGETGFKQDLLGSVTARVAKDAPCSVLIPKFIE